MRHLNQTEKSIFIQQLVYLIPILSMRLLYGINKAFSQQHMMVKSFFNRSQLFVCDVADK